MLVLTREVDQDIVIGGDVRIRVLRVNGGRVRIGIDAPRSVRVTRGELLTNGATANGTDVDVDDHGWLDGQPIDGAGE